MKNRITAILMSATLAVSGLTAAPARATSDGEKAILLLLGAAALYGIAKSAEKDEAGRSPNRAATGRDHWYRNDRDEDAGRRDRAGRHQRDGDERGQTWRNHEILPAQCLRETDGRGDSIAYLDRSCMARSGYRGRLPEGCAALFPTRRGYVPGLGARCLSRKGYILAGGRH